ncbi:MAG TPA: hypothetical protein VMH84_09970 [Xanthobacteraceae bacterium]|nr:hypothetical protein [Xanthobacteraceae bacterium]
MSTAKHTNPLREPVAEQDQKRVALSYLHEAWAEARLDGVEDDCMAQACLFAAFAELVSTYGEEAAAAYAAKLANRINNGEFSIDLSRQ